LTVFNALVMGTILLLLGFALFFLNKSALFNGIENTARDRANAGASTIESGGSLSDAYIQQLTLDGVVVLVRDRNGRVLRRVNLSTKGKIKDPAWREAISSGGPASGTAVLSGDDPYYIHAVPVNPPGGRGTRVFEAAKPYEPAVDTLETFGTVLVAGIGTTLLLSISGAYFLARVALKPVAAVTRAARQMGEGDLSKRLPVANPKDEVGLLAATINALLSRLEAAFARREEALARQRRFAADASHELRTPLTTISGHAEMLDEWALEEDPARAGRSISAIRREARRTRTLVESLLALTRGDEGANLQIGYHDLRAVVEEAVQAARIAADGRVSVEYARPEREVRATFDRGSILQVASILLDNAVKYTPQGGAVTVGLREEDSRAVMEISDTGAGISEEELPLIFERFHRADPSRADGGMGLGLSIARQITEAHGGEIKARSILGEGSTFALVLPQRPRA
jgi:signal transduction histidine kinase